MKSVSTIQAKFLRLNVKADFTKLFGEIDMKSQNVIKVKSQFLPNEVATLCFFPDDSYWWVLTTSRIIMFENNNIKFVFLEEINSIEPKEIFANKATKRNSTNLDLSLKNGNDIKLRVERNTWHAVYSILKFVSG